MAQETSSIMLPNAIRVFCFIFFTYSTAYVITHRNSNNTGGIERQVFFFNSFSSVRPGPWEFTTDNI